MITRDSVKQVKSRGNTSVDAGKTQERFERLWKDLSSNEKKLVEDLADIGRSAIYRSYKTGIVSMPTLMAASQAFNVNPTYLTGESDEAGEFSDEIITAFLRAHGYPKFTIVAAPVKKERKPRKARTPKEAAPIVMEEIFVISEPSEDADTGALALPSFLANFDEERVIMLIRGIIIRAEEGAPAAIKQVEELGKILLK